MIRKIVVWNMVSFSKYQKSYFFLVLFLTLTNIKLFAQKHTNDWGKLAEITYETTFDSLTELEIDRPRFSETVKKLEGKKITLYGYVIPLQAGFKENVALFSSLPFDLCYFCGGAGPETVVEIIGNKKLNVSNKRIGIQGTLVLNSSSYEHHIYILKDVKLIK